MSGLTYVRTGRSFACVGFVVDAVSRRIVDWQVSSSLRSDLALDALEQAISDRLHTDSEHLVHHSDRGVQSITQYSLHRAPALAGIESSVGSRGDSCDNVLADTIIGLYKTDLVHPRSPRSTIDDSASHP